MKIKIILWGAAFLFFDGMVLAFAQPQGNLTEVLQDFSRLDSGEKNVILSSMGVPDASEFSLSKVIGCLIFSGIGFIAFVYGKKQGSLQPLLIGIALMVYPYFFKSALWLYLIGIGLCLVLYYWRD